MTDSQNPKGKKKPQSRQKTASGTAFDPSFDIEAFLKASMHMAAESGWASVTPEAVIERMGLGKNTLPDHIQTSHDILLAFEKHISAQVRDSTGDFFSDETVKDKLFDIFMERFEAMRPYKSGLKSVFKGMNFKPKSAFLSKRPFRAMIKEIFETASGEEITCPKGEVKLIGLSLVYLKTAHVWFDDETDDMSETMAELDKNLSLGEEFVTTLGL